MNDEQLNNWFNDIFESIATLAHRVNSIEQTMNWQRELAMKEISKMSQEAEHARSLPTKDINDLSPETRAMVEEGLEQARRGEFVEGPDLDDCAKRIEAMDKDDKRELPVKGEFIGE